MTCSPVRLCHVSLCHLYICVHFRKPFESRAERCFHISHHIGLHRFAHCAPNPHLVIRDPSSNTTAPWKKRSKMLGSLSLLGPHCDGTLVVFRVNEPMSAGQASKLPLMSNTLCLRPITRNFEGFAKGPNMSLRNVAPLRPRQYPFGRTRT